MKDLDDAIFHRLSTDTAAAGALDAEATRYLNERQIPTAGYTGLCLAGGIVTILAAARAARGLEATDPDALPGGEIYREGSVPQDAGFPRIHYGQVTGVPDFVYTGPCSERAVALIKAVDAGFDMDTAYKLFKRLDVLFNCGRPVSIAAGDFTITCTKRARLIEHTEDDDDQRYQHLGGEYELFVV